MMMDDFWLSVDFCPTINGLTTNALALEIDRVLFDNVLCDVIRGRYDEMISSYCKCKERFFPVPASSYETSSRITQLFASYDRVGFDLPVWVKPKHMNERDCTKRIMLVAEKPLRNKQSGKGFSLSTPFGMHTPTDEQNNEIVIELIKGLLRKKALVYLTDSCKLYFKDDENRESKKKGKSKKKERSKSDKPKEDYNAYRTIFGIETDKFKPDIILALGEDALKAVALQFFSPGFVENTVPSRSLEISGRQMWALVHPSKRTHGKVAEKLNEGRGTITGKTSEYVWKNYYMKVVEQIFNDNGQIETH